MSEASPPLLSPPLDALHRSLGARLVPFAGYAMPVQYPEGILAEHRHTRAKASLFDVSHMGQVEISGPDAARWLETLVPGDIDGLAVGRTRYSVLTTPQGGILDDLMISRLAQDRLFLIVNAARKAADLAHLGDCLPADLTLTERADRALLALQGPMAAASLALLAPEVADMGFLSIRTVTIAAIPCLVGRSGYTGEDGFELSVPAAQADTLAQHLLALPDIRPAGLGARDSLRLEAGLPLYGADIDTGTTPVEAGLAWIVGKRRRTQGGFPGDDAILTQLRDGPARLRVGLRLDGRAPARAHTPIVDADGAPIGVVTSGGFAPSLDAPIAMGYVPADLARPGTALGLVVRGKTLTARVASLPFVPHRYHTSQKGELPA